MSDSQVQLPKFSGSYPSLVIVLTNIVNAYDSSPLDFAGRRTVVVNITSRFLLVLDAIGPAGVVAKDHEDICSLLLCLLNRSLRWNALLPYDQGWKTAEPPSEQHLHIHGGPNMCVAAYFCLRAIGDRMRGSASRLRETASTREELDDLIETLHHLLLSITLQLVTLPTRIQLV